MPSDTFWLTFGGAWLLLALCLLAIDRCHWKRYLRSVILSGTVILTVLIVRTLR